MPDPLISTTDPSFAESYLIQKLHEFWAYSDLES